MISCHIFGPAWAQNANFSPSTDLSEVLMGGISDIEKLQFLWISQQKQNKYKNGCLVQPNYARDDGLKDYF